MNFDKILKICKAKRSFVVFGKDKKAQWLGDSIAIYLITNYPKFTPEYLTAIASLKPDDVESTLFKNADFPEWLNAADSTDDEILVDVSEITINFSDGKYTPVFTTKGVRFIKTIYLEPFKGEEVEIYQRETADGKLYFVVKVGMFVSAIIMAQNCYLDFETVSLFQKLAEKINQARIEIEAKSKEE